MQSDEISLESFPTTAERVTFACVTTSWVLGTGRTEFAVPRRDPQLVLAQLPEDAICFTFHDRLVARVVVDDRPVELTSGELNVSLERYLVNVQQVYTRREVTRMAGHGLRVRALRQALEREGGSHVAYWGDGNFSAMPYDPEIDIQLTR